MSINELVNGKVEERQYGVRIERSSVMRSVGKSVLNELIYRNGVCIGLIQSQKTSDGERVITVHEKFGVKIGRQIDWLISASQDNSEWLNQNFNGGTRI